MRAKMERRRELGGEPKTREGAEKKETKKITGRIEKNINKKG